MSHRFFLLGLIICLTNTSINCMEIEKPELRQRNTTNNNKREFPNKTVIIRPPESNNASSYNKTKTSNPSDTGIWTTLVGFGAGFPVIAYLAQAQEHDHEKK